MASFFENLITDINRAHCKRMGIETTAYDLPLSQSEANGRLSDDELMRILREQDRNALIAAEGALLSNPGHNGAYCNGVYLNSNGHVGFVPQVKSV